MKKVLLILLSFFSWMSISLAQEDYTPNAKSAILVDSLSGKVLYEKNADEKLPPASMTNIMTT